jgi:hypothetical protein
MLTNTELGFYTTLVCEGAEESLELGGEIADGVTEGTTVDLAELTVRQIGSDAAQAYGYGKA